MIAMNHARYFIAYLIFFMGGVLSALLGFVDGQVVGIGFMLGIAVLHRYKVIRKDLP